jgi:glycerophosphoryl diester phosphodiesterase
VVTDDSETASNAGTRGSGPASSAMSRRAFAARLARTLAAAAFMTAPQTAAGGAGAPGAPGAGRVRVAAHRGGAALWPENSLLAFTNALGLGVDLVETDVHLTADGEVVILHDPTLERTTSGQGAVSGVTAGALADVRLRGPDGRATEEGVPRLAALLDVLRPSRVELLLEIKVDAARQRYPGIEEKVLALVKDRQLFERTLFMGFQPDTVRRVRELDRTARTVLLVSRSQLDRQRAAPTQAVRWTVDTGASEIGLQHTALDAAVVADARAAGLGIAAWTVNEEGDIRRVIALGVDVVISDRPDVALRLVGR